VGGALRGRGIEVPDRGVRPTSARAREAIFDILGAATVDGARVLDLYAGAGALGIEALSRGAALSTFVEKDPAAIRRLEANLCTLGLEARSRVVRADLGSGVVPAGAEGPWDLVFLDPPYETGAGALWLAALGRWPWDPGVGLVVYERRRGTEAPPPPGLRLLTERRYGDAEVSIYRSDAAAGNAGRASGEE
jgi:16S rRNA (guanine966-N2)-methyltransferase